MGGEVTEIVAGGGGEVEGRGGERVVVWGVSAEGGVGADDGGGGVEGEGGGGGEGEGEGGVKWREMKGEP